MSLVDCNAVNLTAQIRWMKSYDLGTKKCKKYNEDDQIQLELKTTFDIIIYLYI